LLASSGIFKILNLQSASEYSPSLDHPPSAAHGSHRVGTDDLPLHRPGGYVRLCPKSDTIKGGIPFDYPGVEFGHQGEDCTFETLLKRFGLKDRALHVLAEIVHDADLKDAKFGREEAKGVDAVIRGLAATIADDHALLAQGLVLLEAMYASIAGSRMPSRGSRVKP
jgi:hypothetical protein